MSTELRLPLILVVDDVEEDRMYLQSILEGGGYEVCSSENAEAGLWVARQRHPSLIVMDIVLPGIDGVEATRRLKLDPLTARTPVIMVTGQPLERRTREARFDALLEKPVDGEVLLEHVRRLL
jgi:two-component system cell cycle response regulator DivK